MNQLRSTEIEALVSLANSPGTRKAIEDQHSRLVAERTARNARIKSLDKQAELDWPASQAAIHKAIAAREKAIRDLSAADAMLNAAKAESFNQTHAYTRARHAEELALAEDADLPTIAAFKDELLAELSSLGKPSVIVSNVVQTRSEATGKPIRTGVTNMASIVARMAAVRAAYHDADLLKLENDQRRLPSIIAEIRASFPKVDNNPGRPAL